MNCSNNRISYGHSLLVKQAPVIYMISITGGYSYDNRNHLQFLFNYALIAEVLFKELLIHTTV